MIQMTTQLNFYMPNIPLYQYFCEFALLAPFECKLEGHRSAWRMNWNNDESACYKNKDSCRNVEGVLLPVKK